MGGEERTWRSVPYRPPLPHLPLFDITHVALERALSGASLRQQTLTENLANANTPGYQRKDVDFHGTLQRAMVGGTPGARAHRLRRAGDRRGRRPRRRRHRRRRPRGDRCSPRTASSTRRSPPSSSRTRRDPPHRDGPQLAMGLFDSINAAGSALTAERLRMDVTAENLANAQSTRGADGQPYRRKEVVLQQKGGSDFGQTLNAAMGAGGRTAPTPTPAASRSRGIVEDQTPFRLSTTRATRTRTREGYVEMPNVNPVTEMVDLISASRGYEANVTAMQTAKSMFSKTLDILR